MIDKKIKEKERKFADNLSKKSEEGEIDFKKNISRLKEEFSEEKVNKTWEKTVNAIIVFDGKVLMVKRLHHPFKNTWALPGGHIEPSETDVRAVIREVKEETGLEFYPKYFGSYEESFEEIGWHSYVSTFFGDFKGVLKKPDNKEIAGAKWFTFDELKEAKIGFEHRKIIEEYFALQ